MFKWFKNLFRKPTPEQNSETPPERAPEQGSLLPESTLERTSDHSGITENLAQVGDLSMEPASDQTAIMAEGPAGQEHSRVTTLRPSTAIVESRPLITRDPVANYGDAGLDSPLAAPSAQSQSVSMTAKRAEPINCVEIVYDALDQLDTAAADTSNEEFDVQVVGQVKHLAESFRTHGYQYRYESPISRFAYLYAYATIRANVLADAGTRYREVKQLLAGDAVRVACIGGGPGTDLVGLTKVMGRSGGSATLTATIYDRVEGWMQCWDALREGLSRSVTVSANYVIADFRSEQRLDFAPADLYVMSYCLSEFRYCQEDAQPCLARAFTCASPGSLFLFTDNNHTYDFVWFEDMCKHAGLELVSDVGGQTRGKFSPYHLEPREEQVRLEGYHGRLLARLPFADINPVYRLARKL